MKDVDIDAFVKKEDITVEYFFEKAKEKFNIKLLTNALGMERKIIEQNLHRPGLALAGFVDLFSYKRVQICGNTEYKYLSQLSHEQRINSLEKLFKFELPCIILTDSNKPTSEMIELAEKFGIPVFGTDYPTTKLTYLVSDFLDDQFAPTYSIHGSFVDVYGVGMLFTGSSGIGKSEVALDLVERGHRLVADDVVILTKKGERILMGSGTNLVKHFMEIRGIGILDIRSMFGVRAIRYQKRLEIIIELEHWNKEHEYTRTGLENKTVKVGDVEIPYVRLPILPGKNITVVSEVLALNYLLKHYGFDAAKVLKKNLATKLKDQSSHIDRVIDDFEHDFE
ncbi:MAG: HPr kinase/phosphorylase [Chlorobi bacterium]|nr:HPr kinase/phosphorylase [Chlorobiota bacterium]